MSININATGNIGNEPRVRLVTVGYDKKEVVDFNVYLDNLIRLEDGNYQDRGGFWVRVTLWPNRNADKIASLYQKGQRVNVIGRMTQNKWTDEQTGEERIGMQVNAHSVGILPTRVEAIKMQARSSSTSTTMTEVQADLLDDTDDIPF